MRYERHASHARGRRLETRRAHHPDSALQRGISRRLLAGLVGFGDSRAHSVPSGAIEGVEQRAVMVVGIAGQVPVSRIDHVNARAYAAGEREDVSCRPPGSASRTCGACRKYVGVSQAGFEGDLEAGIVVHRDRPTRDHGSAPGTELDAVAAALKVLRDESPILQ